MPLFRPKELIEFLQSIRHHPSQLLSQNFLIDGNILHKIVDAANICEGDLVIEIGPGPGVLTEALLEKGAIVAAIEKDTVFAQHLPRLERNPGTLSVYAQDVLDFSFEQFLKDNLKPGQQAKIVSNLPYHLTSPIFDRILPLYPLLSQVVVMIQKEVALRIVSKENSKDFSSFSIFCQFYSDPTFLFSVSPGCFYPAPKVTSAVISCRLKQHPSDIDPIKFFAFIKLLFCTRRKMISTSLKSHVDPALLQEAFNHLSIHPQSRPEALSLQKLLSLYSFLKEKNADPADENKR